MKLPVHIAKKLVLLLQGETLAASPAKHAIIEELIDEGIIERKGRVQKTLTLTNAKALEIYLHSKLSINDLMEYIQTANQSEVLRSQLVVASSNSKLKTVRTFKGFLINCYSPIQATLNNEPFLIESMVGSFQFIYDFENFLIANDITIVGIENPENFRHIENQKYLFDNIKPLFVSRYPQNQSKDLIKWLMSIPNNYLYFGDLDLAGIGIYLNEYKKHLKDRASFFIPDHAENLLNKFGNKELYDNQIENFDIKKYDEIALEKLIALIHKLKKGLEQEVFIKSK